MAVKTLSASVTSNFLPRTSMGVASFSSVNSSSSSRLAPSGLPSKGRSGTDGELETFHAAVAELHGPHDGVGRAHGDTGAAHGSKVGVGTSGDGALGADLHAGIAFPAGVGFLVVRLHFLRIEDHQVVRADVHAGRLFATLAAVAFGRIDKRRHNVSSNS